MDTSNTVVIEAVPPSSAPSQPKRQRRSVELKRQIVEETLIAGASVARVARAHGINANQVFQWRRLYEAGRLGPRTTADTRLLPVTVTGDFAAYAGGGPSHRSSDRRLAAGSMELELRCGRVRVEGPMDPATLRTVLECLR